MIEMAEHRSDADYRYAVDDGGEVVVTRCVARGGHVSVPSSLGGRRVFGIGDECFASVAIGSVSMKACNGQLESVELPDGLARIGRAAFRGCSRLAHTALPGSLIGIGDLAFSCTNVRELRIPAACADLSPLALRTGPESLAGAASPYRSMLDRISVDAGNPVYFTKGGALCRRADDGRAEVVLCPGRADEVDLRGIARVAPTAFAGTYEVGTLRFDEAIAFADGCGLALNASCGAVEVARESGSGSPVFLAMPMKGLQRRVFESTAGRDVFDLEAFLAAYDAVLVDEADRLLRSKLMLARLARPVYLEDDVRSLFERVLAPLFETLCVQFGARGHWQFFEDMADAGILDADSVSHAIDVLAARGDGLAVARLLEMKRERFGGGGFCYDL